MSRTFRAVAIRDRTKTKQACCPFFSHDRSGHSISATVSDAKAFISYAAVGDAYLHD